MQSSLTELEQKILEKFALLTPENQIEALESLVRMLAGGAA